MTRLEAVKRRILIGSDMDYAGVCPSADSTSCQKCRERHHFKAHLRGLVPTWFACSKSHPFEIRQPLKWRGNFNRRRTFDRLPVIAAPPSRRNDDTARRSALLNDRRD